MDQPKHAVSGHVHGDIQINLRYGSAKRLHISQDLLMFEQLATCLDLKIFSCFGKQV